MRYSGNAVLKNISVVVVVVVACPWFVAYVLSVLVCLFFLLTSLAGYGL